MARVAQRTHAHKQEADRQKWAAKTPRETPEKQAVAGRVVSCRVVLRRAVPCGRERGAEGAEAEAEAAAGRSSAARGRLQRGRGRVRGE
jgi:hypothetical protein